MSRKRTRKNAKEEIGAMKKVLCDEAQNQMKMRNYAKAIVGYNQVSVNFRSIDFQYQQLPTAV